MNINEIFGKVAQKTAGFVGSSWAFILAFTIIILWAVTGPLFNFSNNWQLFINSLTTIVTFLMVFVIQNAQNRDGKAIQIKLDELIHATKSARNKIIDAESLTEDKLQKHKDDIIKNIEHKKVRKRKNKKK